MSIGLAVLVVGCGGSGDGSETDSGNRAPQAVAGPDQVVDEQAEVTLDGSASTDSDGAITSFQWAQISGPPVVLDAPTSAVTRFTTPPVGIAKTLTFELRVADAGGASGTDRVDVVVNPIPGLNLAPVADAGLSRTLSEFGGVALDGTGSTDPDGLIASYAWGQVAGPVVSLSNPAAARPVFTAPGVAGPTPLSFELTVTDNEGAEDTSSVTIIIVPAGNVSLSGIVSFDRVPATSACFLSTACLDYGATEIAPARDVPIQVIDAANGVTVLASGTTDAAGQFTLTVQNFSDVFLRARAEVLAADRDIRVVDNTNGDALYVVDGQTFNTGGADLQQELHAASGWTGIGYGEPRSAAPLAILDLIYDAAEFVSGADPSVVFPALEVHWSINNVPCDGCTVDVSTGQLRTSFYRSGPGGGIFLLGAENDDTDEYDRHVIAHEWGHYLESTFSRSDSIGGPHTLGDQLDMRVAFGEGWGNALAAMVTADPVYKDTLGPRQGAGFDIDIEGESPNNEGWYSEKSVHEILYDLFDANPDLQPGTAMTDQVNLGFAPIFDAFANEQRTTTALTSLFPFIDAVKDRNPAASAAIDALLDAHDIESIDDAYGSTEDNAGKPASADVLPIYASLAVNSGPVNVCSTDDFSLTFTGATNKLGSRRYLRFTTASAGTHTIRATTTSAPNGKSTDPDIWLHHAGPIWVADAEPTAACTATALDQCVEAFSRSLQAGAEYIVEVYEWTNTNASDDPDYPPIGRACFDVEVTQP